MESTLAETALSLVSIVCELQEVFHRTTCYMAARSAYVAAMFNGLAGARPNLQPALTRINSCTLVAARRYP
jgi:hypothetical protein